MHVDSGDSRQIGAKPLPESMLGAMRAQSKHNTSDYRVNVGRAFSGSKAGHAIAILAFVLGKNGQRGIELGAQALLWLPDIQRDRAFAILCVWQVTRACSSPTDFSDDPKKEMFYGLLESQVSSCASVMPRPIIAPACRVLRSARVIAVNLSMSSIPCSWQ